MNIAGLLFLLLSHYVCGKGVLSFFKLHAPRLQLACLSMMMGVVIISFGPCFLQLMHVPIDTTSVLIATVVITLLCSINLLLRLKKPMLPEFRMPELYEWPFIAVITALALLSIWRCFYYPPFARDMLSGPELIAEYTVREKTMVNSVYSIDLHTTNNYLKSPFITSLQIIYKLLVCSFGQLWLAILSTSFIIYLYSLLKERTHAFIAGALMFLFMTVPDVYAYSYLMLYDYSNMVFFFCGFYFFMQFVQGGSKETLFVSALLLGFATYVRTETVVLVVMMLPLLFIRKIKNEITVKQMLFAMLVVAGVPVLFYLLCNNVFIPSFVPVAFNVANELNHNPGDVSVFFKRLMDIHTVIIFSSTGVGIYGYFMWLFYAVAVMDLIWIRRMSGEAKVLLYGILVVITGLAFIGYLVPIADVMNTTKRGLFKAIPLMVLYLSRSYIVRMLAGKLQGISGANEKKISVQRPGL